MDKSTVIKTFDSGLRLAYVKRDFVRSVGISITCGVGSVVEDEKTHGLSHFLEHMFFKGTKTRTYLDISKGFEDIGASNNAYTATLSTCFYALSLDSDLEKCAELLSDMMLNSVFDENEMEKEKKVVIEEIRMCGDDNESLVFDLLNKAIYGENSSIGKNIIGTEKNIKSFKRNDLIEFVKENYVANDIVITICGNVSYEKCVELVEKYFEGKFPQNKNRKRRDEHLNTFSKYIYKFKDIEQANIAIAFPSISPKNKKESMAANIACDILGGGMSSRLFQEIREKNGLAYSVHAYRSSYYDNANAEIYIGTNIDSIKESLDLTKKIIQDIKKEGFSQDEVKRAIKGMTSRAVCACEGTANMMRIVGRRLIDNDEVFDINEYIDLVESITLDDVNKAFLDTFDISKASAAYVGRKINIDILEYLKK